MDVHAVISICCIIIGLLTFPAVHGVLAVRKIPAGDHTIPGQFLLQISDLEVMKNVEHNLDRIHMQSMKTTTIKGVHYMLVSGSDSDIDQIQELSGVTAIEPNMRMYANGVLGRLSNEVQKDIGDPELDNMVTENDLHTSMNECYEQDASILWGLDRIDQRHASGPLKHYNHGSLSDGRDVISYVIDSGVNVNDPDFEGRAVWGFTATDMDGDMDLNGHGTHVAGTMGSATYGVSKKTIIVAVKVLNADGAGSANGLIEALDWIIQDHMNKGRPKSVMNLSLGFSGISTIVDNAIQQAIDEGITAVVAAGNENSDACFTTPAHIPDVITVGASDVNDIPASFVKWGECLDLWAPGVNITSLYIYDSVEALHGTSMASPHVAGVVARYLSAATDDPTPAEVAHWVTTTSTTDALYFNSFHESNGSPNRLLHMDCAQDYTTPYPLTPGPSTIASPGRGAGNKTVNALLIILCVLLTSTR